MPLADFWIVIRWWGTLFFIGAAAFPLTKQVFGARSPHGVGWFDEGYLFAKAVGLIVITWIVYALGTLHIAPFTVGTVIAVTGVVFVGGIALEYTGLGARNRGSGHIGRQLVLYLAEEAFFLSALLFWAWIKGYEPSIRGLEKFMDYGFMQSIANSSFFPPVDMWYPPNPINYYYFGHLVTALLSKLASLDLAYAFNLMLATIFAFTFTMSFSIGRQLMRTMGSVRAVAGGFLTAFLVTLAGNLQTLYAFTKGYTGDDVKPFWELFWAPGEFWVRVSEGLERYWYANATRFIPFSIHEFPSYSFVVSDIHGHVLSIPFVLLAIGLLVIIFGQFSPRDDSAGAGSTRIAWLPIGFYGIVVGALLMTNALDGPIYFGLFVAVFLIHSVRYLARWKKYWKLVVFPIALVLAITLLASLPFLWHFKSFVSGVAINCPLPFFANTKIGPILFEGVEKCQRSPFWMLWMLWGFFWFCGSVWIFSRLKNIRELLDVRHVWRTNFTQYERILVVVFLLSFGLIVFPEFFYFKDIYPQHFRSNTMFKLGYQAFILWSIVSGYAIMQIVGETRTAITARMLPWVRRLVIVLLVPQLFLVSIYPIFSVRSYFGGLREYQGIYGLTWMMREYPDDFSAMYWLKYQAPGTNDAVLVEADGDSYTDYERFSVFTGMPTPIGWAVHEWLWRGSYDVVAPRREDVRLIYESEDLEETRRLLDTYRIRFIIVGTLEREKFTGLREEKIMRLAEEVFRSGDTVIYDRGR